MKYPQPYNYQTGVMRVNVTSKFFTYEIEFRPMSGGEREWIAERVRGLTEEASDMEPSFIEEIDNSFNTWSALKLIVHATTINMYTKVISEHYDDFFYIDALAGSGLSEYGEGEDGEYFHGSPIVAAKHASEPFTKMYFIDEDEDRCDLLEQRLEYIFLNSDIDIKKPGDWEVICGDSNVAVDGVINDIWDVAAHDPSFHTISFIDNQALDFNWESMEEIASISADFIVNYPGAMGVGMNINNKAAHSGALKDFFGRDLWNLDLSDRDEYRDTYINQMNSLFSDDSHRVPIRVESGTKSYNYDMIYATRDTSGGSEYVEAVEYVKEFVENVDGADVEEMLELMQGDQAVIDGYLPEDREIDDELLDGNNYDLDENQSGLGDFV